MREIKFRAWIKKKSVMRKVVEWLFNGRVGVLVHDSGPFIIQQEDHILMQYTGLKDKNGVEIYEGDVVKAWHDEYEQERVEKVIFENGTFSIGRYWKDGIHDWYSMEQWESINMEVIGNIHSNPELLKGDE